MNEVPPKPQVGIMIRTVVSGDPEYADPDVAKLVQYIPAQVLAACIPLIARTNTISAGSTEFWIWTAIGVGALAMVGCAPDLTPHPQAFCIGFKAVQSARTRRPRGVVWVCPQLRMMRRVNQSRMSTGSQECPPRAGAGRAVDEAQLLNTAGGGSSDLPRSSM